MAFVLFLLPEPVGALAEVRRALRAGGVLGIATWVGEPTFPALEIWFEELASLGFAPVRWPTLTASEEDLCQLLADAGFARTRTWSSPFLFHPNLDSFLELRAGLGRVWLDALAPDVCSAFLERVRRPCWLLIPSARGRCYVNCAGLDRTVSTHRFRSRQSRPSTWTAVLATNPVRRRSIWRTSRQATRR